MAAVDWTLYEELKETISSSADIMSAKYAFTKTLKEVRFHMCHTSKQSDALRSFLLRAYPTMKKNNPHVPIMIREAQGVEPKVFARYEFGNEKMVPLADLADKDIETRITELVKNGFSSGTPAIEGS